MQLRLSLPYLSMAEVKQLSSEATNEIVKFAGWLAKTPSSSWAPIPDRGLLACIDPEMKSKLEPLCLQLVII
jgi:hypothetical protein